MTGTETSQSYKSMETQFYENNATHALRGNLISYSDGTGKWIFVLWSIDGLNQAWKGTLQELADKLLAK